MRSKYFVFVDPKVIDLDSIANRPWPWPDIEGEFFAVHLEPGQKITDSIAFIELMGEETYARLPQINGQEAQR